MRDQDRETALLDQTLERAMPNPFPTMWEVLGHCIPEDHCEQVDALYFLRNLPQDADLELLDHGCGAGRLRAWLLEHKPRARYSGVDLEASPEVADRNKDLAGLDCFSAFDGLALPFPDSRFDVVYSSTVFEHVRHPDRALAEIRRVLKPGGSFLASVAYLYPYHSYSIQNFTPYGWHTLLSENGFQVMELRPGIDALASVVRGYRGNPASLGRWFSASPFNAAIEARARAAGQSVQQINMRKIMNTGVLFSRSMAV